MFKATEFNPQRCKTKPSTHAGQTCLCLLTVVCGDHLQGSDVVDMRSEDLGFQKVLK